MSAGVARLVRVSGRVQGVFFRAWAQQQAEELGIWGWVRNCADGTVEAHVAGEPERVERMIERLRVGPARARVDEVRVDEAEPDDGRRFEIRRG